MTEFLFAPMEGITLSGFRRVHHGMFGGADAYYTPFIAPDSRGSFKPKFLRELTADCGELAVVPQLLVNNAEAFCRTAELLCELGFTEINLNAGCPSGTVFAKHKGAGMLSNLEGMESILDSIFEHAVKRNYSVSIKTRMGVHSTEEFPAILKIYEKYPVSKLIVHARCRDDYYRGSCSREGFARAARESSLRFSYNGDLASRRDLEQLKAVSPQTRSFMIGRAAIANPALFRVLRGGEQLKREELKEFHGRLLETALAEGLSPGFAVERMKTVWSCLQALFPNSRRELKALRKARSMGDFLSASNTILREGSFCPEEIGPRLFGAAENSPAP